MNSIPERLQALRQAMLEQDVQAVIVPTSDYHDTEYVADFFQARVYLSGFTGSQGTLVVLADEAALWVDGRYFLQAENELQGSGIQLMKIGQPGVPKIPDYLAEKLAPGSTVAFDGKTISIKTFEDYQKVLAKKDIQFKLDTDFPGMIWKDRPAFPAAKTFVLEEEKAGKSAAAKLDELRQEIKKSGAEAMLLSKIDEIAWLLNMRAHDIPSLPAPISYLIVDPDGGTLYINEERLDEASKALLDDLGVDTRDYWSLEEDLEKDARAILADENTLSAGLAALLQNPVYKTNPVILAKSIKNEAEQDGFRLAHLKDGLAFVRFMRWIDELEHPVTEMESVKKLRELRAEQPNFLEDSFTTIMAYGDNAAIVHYHPSDEHPKQIEKEGLLLIDFGSHYDHGTTDTTRTLVLGDLTDEQKAMFTDVLKGHIALSSAHFPKGVTGANLDILARAPLWNQHLDYNHGTGHGVGMITNVHEGPQSFRWNSLQQGPLHAGMITSNEPGFYKAGEYGIRLENLLLTVPDGESEFGEYLAFEPLTLIPFDTRGLDVSRLNQKEIDWINDYHKRVYDALSSGLTGQDLEYLAVRTEPIGSENSVE